MVYICNSDACLVLLQSSYYLSTLYVVYLHAYIPFHNCLLLLHVVNKDGYIIKKLACHANFFKAGHGQIASNNQNKIIKICRESLNWVEFNVRLPDTTGHSQNKIFHAIDCADNKGPTYIHHRKEIIFMEAEMVVSPRNWRWDSARKFHFISRV